MMHLAMFFFFFFFFASILIFVLLVSITRAVAVDRNGARRADRRLLRDAHARRLVEDVVILVAVVRVGVLGLRPRGSAHNAARR